MSTDKTVSSFQLDWPYVSAVRAELGADSFDIGPTPNHYKSGRQMYEAVFYTGRGNARKVIARRQAMMLTSNNTQKPYYVCRSFDADERKNKFDKVKPSAMETFLEDLAGENAPQITILKRQVTGQH
jgi:hypothetical protein